MSERHLIVNDSHILNYVLSGEKGFGEDESREGADENVTLMLFWMTVFPLTRRSKCPSCAGR